MRTAFCALLLLVCMGTTLVGAQELTTAQAQQIATAAQAAGPGKNTEVTLSIGGKNVVFTVSRDTFGRVAALPKPGGDSTGIGISRINMQMILNENGTYTPNTLTIIGEGRPVSVNSYQLTVNTDGTIANINNPGSRSGVGAPRIVGGIRGNNPRGNFTPGFMGTPRFAYYPSFFRPWYGFFYHSYYSFPAGTGPGNTGVVYNPASKSMP